MSQSPIISVIIPVYNVEKYLTKCIDSVLAQTYPHLEIILVDDGSTDASGQMCETYAKQDKRVRVIHQQNAGLSAARNAGIKATKGEYLSFIDSDDWVESNFIEVLWKTVCKYQVSIAIVGCFLEFPSKTYPQRLLPKKQKETLMDSRVAYRTNFPLLGVSAWNKLYRADLFKDISFPEGVLYEDMYTNFRVLHSVKTVAVVDCPLYHYNRSNITSITRTFTPIHTTYFTQTDLILKQARQENDRQLIRIIETEQAYHAAGFLRKIIVTHTDNSQVIIMLQSKLRRLLWRILCHPRKITMTCFALVCSINFNLAKRIYCHIVKTA